MATRRSLEEKLESLRALRDDPTTEAALKALRAALSARQAPLVAAAARIAGSAELAVLQPELCTAFERFMQRPEKTDKGCLAKAALADALYRAECDAGEVFLRGVRHVQLEPVWGGKEDTAVELRGTCALGLVRCHHPDAMLELARLLADPEVMARVAAARAVGYSEDADAGVPLLLHRVLAGDADPRVVGACLSGLLALSPKGAVELAGELLQSGPEALFETVCVTLGESRLDAARGLLCRAVADAVTRERRQIPMLALAMLRSDAAWDYLLEIVADGPEGVARDAITALAAFRHDEGLRARVLAAVEARADPPLLAHARAELKHAGDTRMTPE